MTRHVALLALALGCCGEPEEPPVEVAPPTPTRSPTPTAEPPEPEPVPAGWLVWMDEGWGPVTHWVDEEGSSKARRQWAVVAVDGVPWAWRDVPYQVAACPCPEGGSGEWPEPSADCPLAEGGNGLNLVEMTTGREVEILPAGSAPVVGERSSGASLVGSVGPYLFARTDVWEHSCGAHGSSSSDDLVWDVSAQRRASILGEAELALVRGELRERALEELSPEGSARGPDGLDDVEIAQLLPSWEEGRLVMRVQYAAFTSFASSDEQWSSYTESVVLPLPTLPEALAPYSEVPAPVSRFVATHPEATRWGWSTVTSTGAEAFRDAAHQSLHIPGPSGRYTGSVGELVVAVAGDRAAMRYEAVWEASPGNPHLCECTWHAARTETGWDLRDGGTTLFLHRGTADLTGGTPGCCGSGYHGEGLEHVADLGTCLVEARSVFHDRPDPDTARKAYVVQGDVVEVLPPAEAEGPFVYAVYRGERIDTGGYLRADTLSCPGG